MLASIPWKSNVIAILAYLQRIEYADIAIVLKMKSMCCFTTRMHKKHDNYLIHVYAQNIVTIQIWMTNKMLFLFTSRDPQLLSWIGKFIYFSLRQREDYYTSLANSRSSGVKKDNDSPSFIDHRSMPSYHCNRAFRASSYQSYLHACAFTCAEILI